MGEPSTMSPDWQCTKTGRRHRRDLRVASGPMPKPKRTLEAGREAFFKRFVGRCFRCLASDHLVANCRDHVRCFACNGVGHFSRSCPATRPRAISSELRARLAFPPESIHSRISFPPLHRDCSTNITAKPTVEYAPQRAQLGV